MASAPESAIEIEGDEVDDELEFSFIGGEEIREFIIDLIIWLESSFTVGMKAEFIFCDDEDNLGNDDVISFVDDAVKWLKRKTLWPLKQCIYWCAVTQLEQR